jgi:hypothetical protein
MAMFPLALELGRAEGVGLIDWFYGSVSDWYQTLELDSTRKVS